MLLNKVTYLSQLPGWKVAVVTTDQHQRPPFYPFPEKVRMTDLGINYSEDNGKGAWKKITGYLRKRKEHKRKLTALLLKEKPDIVVSRMEARKCWSCIIASFSACSMDGEDC